MDLLAASLRYWVVQKMNTDAAWKNVRPSSSSSFFPPPLRPQSSSREFQLISTLLPSSSLDPSHHLGRFCSRRRRAQDYGLHSSTEDQPRSQPQHRARYLRTRELHLSLSMSSRRPTNISSCFTSPGRRSHHARPRDSRASLQGSSRGRLLPAQWRSRMQEVWRTWTYGCSVHW